MKRIILISLLITVSLAAGAQAYTYAGFGTTNLKLSADFQAGYRWKNNITTSVGLTTVPDDDQPVFFSAHAGYLMKNKYLLFAGYARATKSSDDKRKNKNTFQAGGQWHFISITNKEGKTGTMYLQPMYTYPNYLSLHVGLTLNLID